MGNVKGPGGVVTVSGAQKRGERRFPLEKINEAFEQAEWAAGKGSVARTVVVP